MVVLVTGSRQFTNYSTIMDAVKSLPEKPSLLIHGGASGADSLSGQVARDLGITVRVVPASWSRFGKRAGVMRNVRMVHMRPDVVLAFFSPGSLNAGTGHCVKYARSLAIPVWSFGESGSGSVSRAPLLFSH